MGLGCDWGELGWGRVGRGGVGWGGVGLGWCGVEWFGVVVVCVRARACVCVRARVLGAGRTWISPTPHFRIGYKRNPSIGPIM